MLRLPLLDNAPFGSARSRIDLPQTAAAEKRVSIMTKLHAFRQTIYLLRVTASQHDVVGDEGELQLRDGAQDFALPCLAAELFEACFAESIFDLHTSWIRQITELERKKVPFPN